MKLPTKSALAICAASMFATSASAQVQSVTLQATQDNTLYESATGASSNGAGTSGFAGSNAAASKRRYLVQFDIAGSIPANATIFDATLHLSCTGVPPGAMPDTHQAFRMLEAWGEGTSSGGGQGAPSTPGDATWLHSFFPASTWATPGGDFDPVPTSNFPIGAVGPITITSPVLGFDVQEALNNPSTNYGWMIKALGEGANTARQLASRENATVALRPRLVVRYITPAIIPFCDPANNNSTGGPAVLTGHFGSGFGSGLHLDITGGPLPLANGSRMLGYFLVGSEALFGIPISDGRFCLAGGIPTFFARYNIAGTTRSSLGLFDAVGDFQNLVGTGGATGYGFDVPSEHDIYGSSSTIMAGDTLHFQFWYRDTLSGPGRSNFSNGLSATF